LPLFMVRVYRKFEENLARPGLLSSGQRKRILEILRTSISEVGNEVLKEMIKGDS